MTNIKEIFKIVLVLQFLACTLATYGDPDAEIIEFGSPAQPSRNQLIIEAAIKRGMDGEAVAELLRTRRPVVKASTTPDGFTKTTTYKLEADGSISSKTIIQKRNRYVYNADAIPDELKNSPTGTVTKTYIDNYGNKVVKTVTVNKEKSTPPLLDTDGLDTDGLKEDWLNKAFPNWPEETPLPSPFGTAHRTFTRTYTRPNGERRTEQSWSSHSEPRLTTTHYTPNIRTTSSTTFTKPGGENHVAQTGDINWPNNDFPSYSQPWDIGDPDDSDGWEVLDEPETTTKKKFESWTPKTWKWPEFPIHPTATTTTTIKPSTLKPLPSLDDFLRSQYEQSPNREHTTSTSKSTLTTTTSKSTTTTPKIIKIENLPVVEILHNGVPADENFLKTLPPHLTPRTPTEQVLNIEHKHPLDEDIEEHTPTVEKSVIRSYSSTHFGPEKPRLKDLDTQMQDILKNAGIVPEIEGDSITKTRTEPDGRVITTSYKVTTVPSPPMQYYIPPPIPTYSFNSYKPSLVPFTPHFSPITEFLAKLGLTKFDITSRNGHYSKTFIDENGDVLTATFVLSSPQVGRAEEKPKTKPLK